MTFKITYSNKKRITTGVSPSHTEDLSRLLKVQGFQSANGIVSICINGVESRYKSLSDDTELVRLDFEQKDDRNPPQRYAVNFFIATGERRERVEDIITRVKELYSALGYENIHVK